MFTAFAKEVIRKKSVSFSLHDEASENVEMYANATVLRDKGRSSLASGG
jgi:hypothetical protein